MSNSYTKLARETLEKYLKKDTKSPLDNYPELKNKKAGVFVSLHNKTDNTLRGCIGTIMPTTDSVAEEIRQNAISAATRDSRFNPVQFKELEDLAISVDVLTDPEGVDSLDDLDAKKYGVIVRTEDGRSGLLLPDLPGVEDVDYQVSIAAQKGGIDLQRDQIFLERFEVIRYHESD